MTDREIMQQALEALEGCLLGEENLPFRCAKAMAAIREALEQPHQEPVAWMHTQIEDNVITHRPADLGRHKGMWTPLYTTPPRREWVGLTEEEIEDLYFDGFSISKLKEFARALEARLKEKNHDTL